MPELPEVETIARRFRPELTGRRIEAFVSRWARQASPSVAAVRAGVVGRRIESLERRAKFLVFALHDGGRMLVHLRMSGRLELADPRPTTDSPRHVRAIWSLDDGRRLLFCDARKFGRIVYAPAGASPLDGLGVEPLSREFTPERLRSQLSSSRRPIKPLLLDQAVIAGIGNIYADESLHRARIHPLRAARSLERGEIRALHGAIRAVLSEAIRRNGTSFDWIYPSGGMQHHLRVYGRTGETCGACGAVIVALRVGQRGTHICPNCQPLEA